MDRPDDKQLIHDFQHGDERAFDHLVMRYQERVYWTIRRLVSDHDDANDITQNVFIKAYEALPSFKGDSAIFTWLYRIAVNLALNELRRRKIRKTFSLDAEPFEPAVSADESPAEKLLANERRDAIRRAVERLPEKQKKVFVLRYYEELPYEEISKMLRTSVGGLKANYFHAVQKIGEALRHDLR